MGYEYLYLIETCVHSDAKIFMIYEGTSQIQRLIISRHVLDSTKAGAAIY